MSIYRRGAKGFTLVEIMIVVAIIALIAAIAIPNLLRSRHNANETAAVGTVKSLMEAIESFRAAQTPPAYPALLVDLSNAVPPYVPAALTGATAAPGRQGYFYTYTRPTVNTYTLLAQPVTTQVTGTSSFFGNEAGVITVSRVSGTNATAASPPLE